MPNVLIGKDAIKGMMNGVEIATSLIRPTYGNFGTNVVIESKLRPFHLIANDALTIIKDIKVRDHAERIGLEFIKELCEKQDKTSGDARKTTILLTSELLRLGYDSTMNKLELKRELDNLIPIIEAKIDEQTKKVTDVTDVATTATENPETGKLLQEIYSQIGKDGIIQPEASGTYQTTYKVIDGVRFDTAGYLSPYMVHDEEALKDKIKETKAVYYEPLILVTKKKITTDDDINPLLSEMQSMGKKDLVIFTQDMDSGVASMLIDLHKKKIFNVLIIKAPVLWQNYVFEDFAKCVGATIVEDSTGLNFKNLQLNHLGTCGKIVTDENETILINTKDISDHIAMLTAKEDDDSKLRLSWLVNKTVILKIGANSETDLSYKRLKLYDGIRSSELALKYGVVKGGGQALKEIELPDTEAGKIMKEVLSYPSKQIIENAGGNITIPDTVVDASQTLKNAVRNAIGIASTILTASSIVHLPEPTELELRLLEINGQHNVF